MLRHIGQRSLSLSPSFFFFLFPCLDDTLHFVIVPVSPASQLSCKHEFTLMGLPLPTYFICAAQHYNIYIYITLP